MKRGLAPNEIDAYGTSNTDDEEEPEYARVEFHLSHQYDLERTEQPESEPATDNVYPLKPEKKEEEEEEGEEEKEEEETTNPVESNSSQKISEKQSDAQKHSFASTSSSNYSDVDFSILFSLQQDFLFESVGIKKVYMARPRASPNLEFALKIINDRQCAKKNYIPMELRILAHIRNNDQTGYLQRLEGFIQTKYAYAFISAFQTNLRDICEHRNLSENPSEIKLLMFQLLTAIHSLHSMHVIHRDVKHSNILWQDKKLTLIDYDNATWDAPGRKHFVRLGTEGYIAPEVLAFQRDSDKKPYYYNSKIDIYSAGVVFGTLLFNIQEEDVSEVYIRVFRHKATTLLADPKAADLLLHMLDVDPQRRPTAHMLLSHPYFFQNV